MKNCWLLDNGKKRSSLIIRGVSDEQKKFYKMLTRFSDFYFKKKFVVDPLKTKVINPHEPVKKLTLLLLGITS
jgi:hypothetical protein